MSYYNSILNTTYYDINDVETILNKIKEKAEFTNGKKIKYYNIAATFDLEESNVIINNKKVAILSAFTFCISDGVEYYPFLFRTYEDMENLLILISEILGVKGKKARYYIAIFIHNLSFDSSFFSYLGFTEVFAPKSNKPLYIRMDNYCIEFRCSLYMTGEKLEFLPLSNAAYKKLVGRWDYSKIRHCETELTEQEIAYVLSDGLTLCNYINEQIEFFGNIHSIPRTQHAYVRNCLKTYCIGNDPYDTTKEKRRVYTKFLSKMSIQYIAQYDVLKEAYQGGFSDCNRWLSGQLIYDNIEKNKHIILWDFKSSYPACFVMGYFPIKLLDVLVIDNNIIPGYSLELYKDYIENQHRCVVARAKFTNIRQKEGMEYTAIIPSHKCRNMIHPVIEKGRILSAEYIEYSFTEVDFRILEKYYEWDSVYFPDMYIYEKGKLPKSFISYILELYARKALLSDKKDKASRREYNRVKKQINGLYGVACMDICKLTLYLENGKYIDEVEKKIRDEEKEIGHTFDKEIRKIKSKYYRDMVIREKIDAYNSKLNNGQTVLCFEWGLYCSSIARHNILLGVWFLGADWLYTDTDCLYIYTDNLKNTQKFINYYNSLVKENMEDAMKYYNLPIDAWRPKNGKGEEECLGYYDKECMMRRWQGVRSKSYIKEYYLVDDEGNIKGTDFQITVAGLNKESGRNYMLKKWGKYKYTKEFETEKELEEYLKYNGCGIRREDTLKVDFYEVTQEIYDNFQEGGDTEYAISDNCFEVPAEYTDKLSHIILTDTVYGEVTDYRGKTYKGLLSHGGTYLEPCDFTMSRTKMDLELLTFNTEEDTIGD